MSIVIFLFLFCREFAQTGYNHIQGWKPLHICVNILVPCTGEFQLAVNFSNADIK